MKLNVDCMRAVLLELEKQPLNKDLYYKDLLVALDNFSTDDINYSVLKLQEANYIVAHIAKYDNGFTIVRLSDITYEGHQFLESIRDNKIWAETKSICAKAGSFTFKFISQVASAVLSASINQYLGN